jgi:transcriptional regulator with XRE-family HTH domain
MGPPRDSRTLRGAVRRRFQPSTDAQPGPELTEHGRGQKRFGDGRERLGRQVAVRRAELGLTQANLAERMDVSPATVARIEDGERQSSETLRRLAQALPSEEEGNEVLLRSIERELLGRGATLEPSASGRGGVGRWLWGGLALAALIPVAVLLAGRSSDSGGDPAPEPAAVVAVPPPAPPPVQPVKKEKKPEKAAKAERDSAPAASSDESSSSSDETSSESDTTTTETTSEPVSEPVVTPAPAPAPSRPTRRPSLQHGISGGG